MFKAMIQELLENWSYFNETLWNTYLTSDGKRVYEKCLEQCRIKFPNYVDEIKGWHNKYIAF